MVMPFCESMLAISVVESEQRFLDVLDALLAHDGLGRIWRALRS